MQTVTLEVTQRYIGAEGHRKAGDVINVDLKRARQLIDNNVARVKPGPVETKPAAPAEDKTAKKSSGAPKAGRSTRTRSSSARGKATPSSASPAAPVSVENNANTPGAHGAAGLTFTS